MKIREDPANLSYESVGGIEDCQQVERNNIAYTYDVHDKRIILTLGKYFGVNNVQRFSRHNGVFQQKTTKEAECRGRCLPLLKF